MRRTTSCPTSRRSYFFLFSHTAKHRVQRQNTWVKSSVFLAELHTFIEHAAASSVRVFTSLSIGSGISSKFSSNRRNQSVTAFTNTDVQHEFFHLDSSPRLLRRMLLCLRVKHRIIKTTTDRDTNFPASCNTFSARAYLSLTPSVSSTSNARVVAQRLRDRIKPLCGSMLFFVSCATLFHSSATTLARPALRHVYRRSATMLSYCWCGLMVSLWSARGAASMVELPTASRP